MADPCRLVPARQGGSDQLIAELAIGCDIFCWRGGATRPRARLAIELANSCCVGGIAGFPGFAWHSRSPNRWRRSSQAHDPRDVLGRPRDGCNGSDRCYPRHGDLKTRLPGGFHLGTRPATNFRFGSKAELRAAHRDGPLCAKNRHSLGLRTPTIRADTLPGDAATRSS